MTFFFDKFKVMTIVLILACATASLASPLDVDPLYSWRVAGVVLENDEVVCRCHGVSGTCTVRICWKKIRSFDVISEPLKAMYYSALQILPENSIWSMKGDKSARQLPFLESSPNFCLTTANRPCNSTENCATLCCGRGTSPTRHRSW
jgi:hypothetical protein